MATDKYFALIPFTWTACNNRPLTFASTSLLFKTMIISFLNYQADEYMEGVVTPNLGGSVANARKQIGDLFIRDVPDDLDKPVYGRLAQFIKHVLADEDVASASFWDRKHLEQKLRAFLLAHVDQIEGNFSFEAQSDKDMFSSASRTFHNWVHTTSAYHTPCPLLFPRLPIMLDFLDFSATTMPTPACSSSSIDDRKHVLFELAEYEQAALEEALRRLRKEAEGPGITPAVARAERRKMAVWDMFVDVTNLYGQI
ncbi:uncharacterized protein GGS25DRAFT_212471 [Hypoxylon fragiforme]|uniref:uncharacterized protein n=1 Tax=Hypoxylon fragiforme TaxID=63214 RepID=UPI0020C5EC2F|nr:uncharacterized protein GGS25DRAFT_212471 [Hypoxylon fragiforme]KAI2609366.1 hypothetical protein GGS25DRAFT_212471 [Hypoxylon fragiforme]